MRTLLWLLLGATAGQGEPAAPAPRAGATVEMLPQRGGRTEIRTPQGFVRVDDPRGAASGSGTFGVYPAGAYGRTPPPPGSAAEVASREPAPRPAADPCRRERSRYLRRLLQMDGIDLDDPLAVLDGLSGPEGYAGAALFSGYGLLPVVDPIRPLAWDLELRSLARDLAACAAGARAGPR